MYQDIISWKVKTEQQLVELSNSLSSMQAAKAYSHPLSPPNSEQWEDWLQSTNLEDIPGNDITNMLVNTDPINVEWDVDPYTFLPTRSKPSDATVARDAACASELAMLKEEVATIKRYYPECMYSISCPSNLSTILYNSISCMGRDIKELVCKKQDDSVSKWNQDASLNVNPQLDFKNPLLLFQAMTAKLLFILKYICEG